MKSSSWETMDKHEKIKLVKSLAADGLSATKIAARFGSNVTRNAVIGFAHRQNISLAGSTKRKPTTVAPVVSRPRGRPKKPTVSKVTALKAAKPRKSRVSLQSSPPEVAMPAEAVVIPFARPEGPVNLMDLGFSTCRWPLNSNYRGLEAEEMLFCGKELDRHGPYCSDCVEKFEPFNGKASRGPKLNDDGTPYTSKRKRRPFLRWQG